MSKFRNEKIDTKKTPKLIDGTPLQQHWKVLNFHEQRINRIEANLGENKNNTLVNETTMNLVNNLMDEVTTIKEELETFKKKLGDNNKSTELNVSE
tara:strand:+ start:3776 stop:4063 length:288 start_codon:yes stop_codon:yes gene_type:complete